MNSKRSIVLSTVAIAAIVVLFASGPIVANHQASAVVYGHHGHSRTLTDTTRTLRTSRTLLQTLPRTLLQTLPRTLLDARRTEHQFLWNCLKEISSIVVPSCLVKWVVAVASRDLSNLRVLVTYIIYMI